MKIEETWML